MSFFSSGTSSSSSSQSTLSIQSNLDDQQHQQQSTSISSPQPKQLTQIKKSNELKNSFNGISSGIDKISLYSKDNNAGLACDGDREREIKEAEFLFENLPELVYNVTKINQWGKHQRRNLRLTNKGIDNIRNNDFVSSSHFYSDIKSIYNKDSETFIIEYNGASHPYTYKSSIGYQIVQEISSRLKLKQATEKKKSGYDIAMEFQKKFLHTKRLSERVSVSALLDLHKETDSSTEQNAANSSGSSHATAGLKKATTLANGEMSRSASFENYSAGGDDGSSVSSSPSSNIGDLDLEMENDQASKQSKRATKVSQLLGTTEEQRLQSEVDKIILSAQSSERKAIQQFISNFNVLLKNPATATMITRQFLDSTRQNIICEYKDITKVMVTGASPSSPGGFTMPPEEIDISTIIEKSLEKHIVVRLNKSISQIITQQVAKDEAFLQEQISKLAGKPQAFFGIKEEFMSSNNWKYAILELSCLARCEIPHDKLSTILSSAKAIYNSINYEKNIRNNEPQDYFISADDFLPVYIYVVVNSGVKELEFTNQYLWQLSDPDKLGGEGGYYLTVFSSVLSLIRSLDLERVDKASSMDDLIPSIQLKEDLQPPSIRSSTDSGGLLSWSTARISKKERNQSFTFGDKSISDKSK